MIVDNISIDGNFSGSPLSVSGTPSDADCYGGSDGSIDITVSGGVSPYSFSWSNSATSEDLANLSAGNYSVTVTDNNSSTVSGSYSVGQPTALSLSTSSSDASCNGGSDGSASVSVSGGTSPYSFSWSNGSSNQSISSISAGSYSVTVTDDNGCTASASATVSKPSALNTSISGTSDVSYNGAGDGSINLSVSGGTGSYSYQWSNSASSQDLSGLGAGSYTVTVTDGNGCTATASASISEPSAISPVLECVTDNGNGAYTAEFGYYNPNGSAVSIPIGSDNNFYSLADDQGQPTNFQAGRQPSVFTVTFSSGPIVWTLNGKTSTASSNSPACSPAQSGPDLSNYSASKKLAIQSDKVCGSGSHTDFPVLIDIQKNYLKSTGNGGSVENSNGYDIIFTKADSTQLDHQIESYDPSTGELTAWVKVPSLSASSNTEIYMYYGNSSVSSSQESDSTWSAGYLGVWHMDDVNDHSGNSRHFTDNGSSSASGKIGNARSFDGSSAYLQDADANNYLNGLSGFSVGLWVKSNDTNQDRDILFGRQAGNNSDSYFSLRYDQNGYSCGASSTIKAGIRTTNDSEYNEELGSNVQTTNWQHIVLQWQSGGSLEFYLDGTLESIHCSQSAASGALSGLQQLIVGLGTKNQHWNGLLDELQIANTKRSADWICTQYNNQSNPGSFVTIDTGSSGNSNTPTASTCMSVNSGNWSNAATWDSGCGGSGGIPGAQDSVVIKEGKDVTVNSAQAAKSIRLLGDDNDTSSLFLAGSGRLTVSDSFIVETSCGNKNVFIHLDGSSHLDVNGHMNIEHNGSDDVDIRLNANAGNDAKVSVAGNMYLDLNAGCADDVKMYSFQQNDTVHVGGNLVLDNANTASGHQIDIVMHSSSVLDVDGNIDFRPVADDNTYVKLNNSSKLHIGGDMVRQASPNRYGSIISNNSATILADGSAQQQLGGNVGDGNDGISYINLEINNSGGSFPQLTLDGNVSVSNGLALNDGNIQTGSDTISLTNTSASSLTNYGAQSHIVGYFKRHITRNRSEYVFPVGEGTPSTYYQGAIINRTMTNVNYIVSRFVPNLQRYDSTKLNASTGEFDYNRLWEEGMWIFEPDQQPSFAGFYDVKLWTDNINGLTDNLFGIVKRPRGAGASAWKMGSCLLSNPGGPGRLKAHGYALSTMCNSFSELTGGDGDGTSQPINLISFDAELNNGQVDLYWTTATEINNDYFTIQRSTNGHKWEDIETIDGAGNSSTRIDYETVDDNPHEGISYYRLKQTDFNGEFTYSNIATINNKGYDDINITVYPNPTKGKLNIEMRSSAQSIEMTLYNINGELLFEKQLGSSNGRYEGSFDFEGKLSSGMYFLRMTPQNGDKSYVEKIRVSQ